MNFAAMIDHPPLILDSFAGGGGASTGIEMALGRSPDIAINHNPAALALHEANHPETLHLSENVYKVDPLDYVRGKHIGLAWFSPDCKHFSKAKGGKPVERNIRDLAWIIPGWIERIQNSGGGVDVVILENVEEFKTWGPLIETERGLMPCPDSRGQTFAKWCKMLRRLGGKIEYRELRACDYGAPTIRKRLFIIVRFDGKKIVWPAPTHGRPDDADVIAGRKKPWRTAAEIIDWSLPCPSIFDTSEEIYRKFGVRAVRPLAPATMSRVARGTDRYAVRAKKPCLVSVAHGYSGGRREYPIDDPFGVVTAGGISHALVSPVLTYAQQGGANRSVEIPAHTITASAKDQNALIAPTLVGCGGRAGQSRPRGGNEPLATITAKADACLVSAFVAQHNNDSRREGGVNPGRSATEPMSTITANPQQGIVAAFMSRQFGASVGHGVDEPSATVTAGANKSALIAPHLMTMRNAGKPFNGADEPSHTVTAGGAGLSLVAPFITKYYGVEQESGYDEPLHTATGKARFGHVEGQLDLPPFTEEVAARARQVAAFMREHGFWDEREFVTLEVEGETFTIVDIGMRMLTPRELFSAQGFPADYVIDLDYNGRPLPKSDQISCCGNSVSPPMAAALVAANCSHMRAYLEAAE
jgi:DNA (cytosine-5)-methyltransferase 1